MYAMGQRKIDGLLCTRQSFAGESGERLRTRLTRRSSCATANSFCPRCEELTTTRGLLEMGVGLRVITSVVVGTRVAQNILCTLYKGE